MMPHLPWRASRSRLYVPGEVACRVIPIEMGDSLKFQVGALEGCNGVTESNGLQVVGRSLPPSLHKVPTQLPGGCRKLFAELF